MRLVGRGDPAVTTPASADAHADDWVECLTADGPVRDEALARLHAVLLRAASHQVRRMRGMLPDLGQVRLEELAQQSADEAMVVLLSKLHTFEGRSRFTTWAYKFAILQAATEVRRQAWRGREVVLPDDLTLPDPGPSAADYAEAAELAGVLKHAIGTALTPHQRRVVLALVVDEVPIDVLAERLGTNRNALYKTLHDARRRIRAALLASGVDVPAPSRGRRR